MEIFMKYQKAYLKYKKKIINLLSAESAYIMLSVQYDCIVDT